MATLILNGPFALVELTPNEDGGTVATCVWHTQLDGRLAPPGSCDWTVTYDTLDDAAEYASGHADDGRQDR